MPAPSETPCLSINLYEPRVWLFRGSPSAAIDWVNQHFPDTVPEILTNTTYNDYVTYAANDCTEPLLYILLNYSGSLHLPHPPTAHLVIPTQGLDLTTLKVDWKTTYPFWLQEVNVPSTTLTRVLAKFPPPIVDDITLVCRQYPAIEREILDCPPEHLVLLVDSYLPGYSALQQWLMNLRSNAIQATNDLDPQDVYVWFLRFPECIAAKTIKYYSPHLWFYIAMFIVDAQQRGETYETGLQRFAYWFQTLQVNNTVLKWKTTKRFGLWINPSPFVVNTLNLLLH